MSSRIECHLGCCGGHLKSLVASRRERYKAKEQQRLPSFEERQDQHPLWVRLDTWTGLIPDWVITGVDRSDGSNNRGISCVFAANILKYLVTALAYKPNHNIPVSRSGDSRDLGE